MSRKYFNKVRIFYEKSKEDLQSPAKVGCPPLARERGQYCKIKSLMFFFIKRLQRI